MKFNFTTLHDAFTKVFSKLATNEVDEYVNPIRDWMKMLVLAVLVLLTGLSFFGFRFYTQFGTFEQGEISEQSAVIYNEKEVRTFAEMYSVKEAVFNKLRNDVQYIPPVQQEDPVSLATSTEGALEPLAEDVVAQ